MRKKLRNKEKKLTAIKDLETKAKKDKTFQLDDAQKEKISKKAAVE